MVKIYSDIACDLIERKIDVTAVLILRNNVILQKYHKFDMPISQSSRFDICAWNKGYIRLDA